MPYFGIMLLAALQSVPSELYEAATLDGCTGIQQLFHVTIPYIKPTIISTVLLRSILMTQALERTSWFLTTSSLQQRQHLVL